jgi:integrase
MPKRSTDAPIYRRGDSPYWWTWVYEGGKRVRVSTKCTDRKAALAAATELQRNSAEPGRVHGRETVADALLAFVEAPVDRAPTTRIAYEQRAIGLARILGGVRLSDLSRAHLERYVAERKAGPRTMTSELGMLRSALRLAKQRGRPVPDLDLLTIPVPGSIEPKTRWLTQAELDALYPCLPAARADWVRVAVWTGARREEVNGLDWSDVDLVEGTIRIRGTKGKRKGRNASDRTIPLMEPFAEWLKQQPRHSGPIVKRWTTPTVTLENSCKRAGIARCTVHDFRRTFASRLKQKGVDSMIVAKLLGHTTSRLVDTTYGHLDIASLREAVRKL